MRGPGSKDSSPRPSARRFSAFSLSLETSAGFSREVPPTPLNFSAAAVLVVVIQFALSKANHFDAHVGTAHLSDSAMQTSDSVILSEAKDLMPPQELSLLN
jgi:hypothetical protein